MVSVIWKQVNWFGRIIEGSVIETDELQTDREDGGFESVPGVHSISFVPWPASNCQSGGRVQEAHHRAALHGSEGPWFMVATALPRGQGVSERGLSGERLGDERHGALPSVALRTCGSQAPRLV